MAVPKIVKVEKVRNELRFIREDNRYYYWDFNIVDTESWHGVKGNLILKAPGGYLTALVSAYNNSDDAQFKAFVNLFNAIRGAYGCSDPADWINSWIFRLGIRNTQILVRIYESLINLGYTDIHIAIPSKKVFQTYHKQGHAKFMRNLVKHTSKDENFYLEAVMNAIYHEEEIARWQQMGLTSEQGETIARIANGTQHFDTANITQVKMVLRWWEAMQNEITFKIANVRYVEGTIFHWFCNFVNDILDKVNTCGYKLRKNGDPLKEIAAIEETYKLWKYNEDAKKLSSIDFQKWYYEDNNFVTVFPTCAQDLINCGNDLHNCVGRFNYWERMVDEHNCIIVFIRRKSEPEKNFVCCEVGRHSWEAKTKPWKIRQFLTYNNDEPKDKAIVAFQRAYEEFVQKQKYAN